MNKKNINTNIYLRVEPIRTTYGLCSENDVMRTQVKQAKKSESSKENSSFSKLLEDLTIEKSHKKEKSEVYTNSMDIDTPTTLNSLNLIKIKNRYKSLLNDCNIT